MTNPVKTMTKAYILIDKKTQKNPRVNLTNILQPT